MRRTLETVPLFVPSVAWEAVAALPKQAVLPPGPPSVLRQSSHSLLPVHLGILFLDDRCLRRSFFPLHMNLKSQRKLLAQRRCHPQKRAAFSNRSATPHDQRAHTTIDPDLALLTNVNSGIAATYKCRTGVAVIGLLKILVFFRRRVVLGVEQHSASCVSMLMSSGNLTGSPLDGARLTTS